MDTRASGFIILVAVGLLALILPAETRAHSGGLDKNGCHTNRATGDHHCHRGTPAPLRNSQSPRNTLSPVPAGRARAFANCAEARAAGAAPVRRGDPGYGPHLDRDNDGIGCEPYRGRK
ncbi:excalibur calcium-binding domain-containing protein [Stenotrophomonas sp. JAI102]|uniref:excalibur calcium-binding domain-containing protein n=1 Tax=Stenotrophomonas sp. JAI102 TaxID=2723077 RepID=UPI0015CAD1DC|nr:excalibur calcium-binding domain-containing protein [Stenotrophomonas sp. JAI102]